MREVLEFRAVAEVLESGTMTARLVPFGDTVPYGKGSAHFDAGGIEVPDTVPLTVDHGTSVLDRIGSSVRVFETTDGLYGEFTFVDTPKAQDVRALLAAGAVTDVSVGVLVDTSMHAADESITGTLDHVAVVAHGRFGKSEKPSKVLAVHSEEGRPPMAEVEDQAAQVAEYDDAPIVAELSEIREQLDTYQNQVVDEPNLFESVGDYVKTYILKDEDAEAAEKWAEFALSGETTTTAAGAVPDYLSSEYLSIIDTSRAFVGNIASDPIGSAGMSVVYPTAGATTASVAVQATENTEVDSTANLVTTTSVALLTYAGANKVANQLIRRSSPDFVGILLRELASSYASVTDAASIAKAVTEADDTAILADLGADAALTFAAFNAANSAIIAGVRAPADTVWLAPDRWAQLNSLVDADGRPLLVFGANGPMNAQGQSQFNTMVAQYHGWVVRLDPDAATGTCLIAWSPTYANLEQNPVQLSTLHTDTISTDIGIWGMQNIVTKYPTGAATLTLA